MSNVIELASVTKAQRMGPPDGWYEVYQAPKDGRAHENGLRGRPRAILARKRA